MKYFLFLLIIISSLSYAHSEPKQENFEKLMTSYLQALKNQSHEELKKVTTDKFYQQFKKTGLLDKVFKAQKKGKVKPFDVIFKKASLTKDLYFVNIKNKKKKEYGENWYYIRDKAGTLLLDEMHSLK